MQRIDMDSLFDLTGHKRGDFSVCLGCKICASVCTVNDFSMDVNPQWLLMRIFLGERIDPDEPLIRNCVSCYRCTDSCPWQIRVPEIIRAIRESFNLSSSFERAFKCSISIWGRVYEPYIFMNAMGFLIKGGYLRHLPRLVEYLSIHLPHRVKRT